MNTERYVSAVCNLADDEVIDLPTVLNFIDHLSIPPMCFAQALGILDVSYNYFYTQDELNSAQIRLLEFYSSLHKSMPITIKKLKNILSHPSVNMPYALEKLTQSQRGKEVFLQVDEIKIADCLAHLNIYELNKLNDILGINFNSGEFHGKSQYRLNITKQGLQLGLFSPNNLLYALKIIDNQQALAQFNEYYPNELEYLSSIEKPAWESDIQWDLYDPKTSIDHQILKGLPSVDGDCLPIAYVMGIPLHIIKQNKHRGGLIGVLNCCINEVINLTMEGSR